MTARSAFAPLLAWTALAALTAACGTDTGSLTTDPGPVADSKASTSTQALPEGDPAVWTVAPGQSLQESSTGFTALVSRLACNSGVTGQVLAPRIRMSESEVVVTFAVARVHSVGGRCQSNDQVPYEVELDGPLGDRTLVDGQCLPGGRAATTGFCRPGATRFTP